LTFFFFLVDGKIIKYTTENYEGKTKIEISRLNRMTKSVEHILSYFEVLKGFDKIIPRI
jgi:hypothetical protein